MTDPLIVVEGTLRLPSLRPLADRPLTFGQEWLLAGSRPVLRSRSEVSLYAARLFTEYIKAFALSDKKRSPYQAASIWGVMTERLPSPLSGRGFEPEFPQPVSAMPDSTDANGNGNGSPAQANTINLKVQPPAGAEPARSSRFPTSVKTAIALACAALVAWLMLGHEKRSDDESTLATKQADATNASAPASTTVETPASTPVVVAAQTQAASAASVVAAAKTPAAAVSQPQPASASEVASNKAVTTPLNTRVARSGVVQSASADTQNRNLTPKQKAKLKREAQRLAAEQKRAAASHTVAAQQAPAKRANAQVAQPVASRVAQNDWDTTPVPKSTAARNAPRIDAESLYPAPVQSARASQKDWNSAPRTPARSSDAATLYPAPARSASAQNDWDNAPSSPRAPTRSRLDAATLYPAPARSVSAQSDWDNASSLRAPNRNRPDVAPLYPTPTRSSATQSDRYSAPTYASGPVIRSNADNGYVPPARSAVPEVMASSATASAAASGTSAYARTLRSSARYASPTIKANDSLDVKSLYDMLQHSATLDDNVNVPVRAGSTASAK